MARTKDSTSAALAPPSFSVVLYECAMANRVASVGVVDYVLWCVWAWKDQASFWRIVMRESRSGGVWCSIKHQTQASTLFLITVFFPSIVRRGYIVGSTVRIYRRLFLRFFLSRWCLFGLEGRRIHPVCEWRCWGLTLFLRIGLAACVLVTGSAADTPMGNPYVFLYKWFIEALTPADHESSAREPRSYMSTRDLKEGSCAALRRKAVRSSANKGRHLFCLSWGKTRYCWK